MQKLLVLSFLFSLSTLVAIGAPDSEPDGSTGCTGSGRCWRYCVGSTGDWCYTGEGCSGETSESCATKTKCWEGGCAGATAPGCVSSCPIRNTPTVPHGSTGCARKWTKDNGRCWRYCKGSNGSWCYTDHNCLGKEERCGDETRCDGTSCDGAAPDCVTKCPTEC